MTINQHNNKLTLGCKCMQVYVWQEITLNECLMHASCRYLSLLQVHERNLEIHMSSKGVSLISMKALQQKCKLGIDRDRLRGKETCLWSWALFWDHRLTVTCSRCYWLYFQELVPDHQLTALCIQKRREGTADTIILAGQILGRWIMQMHSTHTSALHAVNMRIVPVPATICP